MPATRRKNRPPPQTPPISEPPHTPPRHPRSRRAPGPAIEELPEGLKRLKKKNARAQAQENIEQNRATDPPSPASIQGRITNAQRRAWATHQEREIKASNQARARIEREREEWNAEVAQFGETEATRRRREETEARRFQEIATTSEVEEIDHKDKITNPNLDITASLRVEKRLE